MSVRPSRAWTFGLAGLALLASSSACASRQGMKRQAVTIAASANALDGDLERLDGTLATVHRLRRVRVEGDRLAAERAARVSAGILGAWRLEHDPLSQAKVEVFEGVRAASDAAGEHGYGVIDYKIGIEEPVPGYSLDRHALRSLVTQLLRLAKPSAFKDEATFFVKYGVEVGEHAAEGIDEVVRMANEHERPPPSPSSPGAEGPGTAAPGPGGEGPPEGAPAPAQD